MDKEQIQRLIELAEYATYSFVYLVTVIITYIIAILIRDTKSLTAKFCYAIMALFYAIILLILNIK